VILSREPGSSQENLSSICKWRFFSSGCPVRKTNRKSFHSPKKLFLFLVSQYYTSSFFFPVRRNKSSFSQAIFPLPYVGSVIFSDIFFPFGKFTLPFRFAPAAIKKGKPTFLPLAPFSAFQERFQKRNAVPGFPLNTRFFLEKKPPFRKQLSVNPPFQAFFFLSGRSLLRLPPRKRAPPCKLKAFLLNAAGERLFSPLDFVVASPPRERSRPSLLPNAKIFCLPSPEEPF